VSFIWPFQSESSSQFERVDQGWDLQSTAGAPVYAIADGVIGRSNADPGGFGNDYPYEVLGTVPQGAPSNTVYYGHIHVDPSLIGKQVRAGQIIGYTNTTSNQNGSAAPPGWLEIGFAVSGTGNPVQHGEGATGAGAAMKSLLTGAAVGPGGAPASGPMSPAETAAIAGMQGGVQTWQQTSGAGPAPPMSDIPALVDYIKQNFPDDAWLLNVPEVATTLEQAVSAGLTPDQIKAKMQQTDWWKHTSQAQIAYDQLKNQNPEELNFRDPGSKANAVLANINSVAASVGLTGMSPAALQQVALQAMQYGWSNQQIQQHLGSMVRVTPNGAGVTSNDMALLAQLEQASGKYLYNPTQTMLNSYAQGIASGRMTMDTYNAFLAEQAAQKYPSMAEAIMAGATPDQIVDPLRTEAASLMEVTPGQVNFISDPLYSKILNYTPPPVGGKAQAPRVMSTSEMDTYLRGTDQYGHTQGARDSASDLSASILKNFGEVR